VHNFTGAKTFKLNLRDYHDGYRLVPFSGDTYGVFKMPLYSTFNAITGNLNIEYEGDSHALGTPEFIIKFNRDVYTAAKDNHSNYWTWKKNRNQARSELEEKYGFDTKHAMHLVRLLRMGAEALETGIIHVKRPDAVELLAIRNGEWSYEQIVSYAEMMDKRVREDLYQTTSLPKRPDLAFAAELLMQIQDSIWETK
jgi:hypothetical protein